MGSSDRNRDHNDQGQRRVDATTVILEVGNQKGVSN